MLSNEMKLIKLGKLYEKHVIASTAYFIWHPWEFRVDLLQAFSWSFFTLLYCRFVCLCGATSHCDPGTPVFRISELHL